MTHDTLGTWPSWVSIKSSWLKYVYSGIICNFFVLFVKILKINLNFFFFLVWPRPPTSGQQRPTLFWAATARERPVPLTTDINRFLVGPKSWYSLVFLGITWYSLRRLGIPLDDLGFVWTTWVSYIPINFTNFTCSGVLNILLHNFD